jgi:hypothetical protein
LIVAKPKIYKQNLIIKKEERRKKNYLPCGYQEAPRPSKKRRIIYLVAIKKPQGQAEVQSAPILP